MNNWASATGLGLIAATAATIAFILYRQRESSALLRDTQLARELRELAGGDAVRLAAVEEFEVGVYKRLFYSGVVGPRVRSAAWALLGAVLAGTGALILDHLDGLVAMILWGLLLALVVVFAVAALVFAGLAVYAAATTPRVSFADFDDDSADPDE